jgi:hypothetical protein
MSNGREAFEQLCRDLCIEKPSRDYDLVDVVWQACVEAALSQPAAVEGCASWIDMDEMVNRFLCWKLPEDFYPDAGVTFNPTELQKIGIHPWPTGTNLLHAVQARAMLECVLQGQPVETMADMKAKAQEYERLLAEGYIAAPTPPSAPVQQSVIAWRDMDSAPKDGTEFVVRYTLQGNVKRLVCWNTMHGFWQSKGESVNMASCEWSPILADVSTRFKQVYCSQCGNEFGAGNSGFSDCRQHNYLPNVEDVKSAWANELIEEIDAISCRYHGDPSYDHDAYWMKGAVKDPIMKMTNFIPSMRNDSSRRYIPDSECKQGKCANPTTGCFGECCIAQHPEWPNVNLQDAPVQQSVREAFEKWISYESGMTSRFFGLLMRKSEDEYHHEDVQLLWLCWQAALSTPTLLDKNDQTEGE